MNTNCEDCAHKEVCAIKKSIAAAMDRVKGIINLDYDMKEAFSVSVSCKFYDYKKEDKRQLI